MAFSNAPTSIDITTSENVSSGSIIPLSQFTEITNNDCSLFESSWRPVYSWRRASTINQLNDPGFTHTAYELDAYILDNVAITNDISTRQAMRGWKCFLGGMIYQVPYPIPGLLNSSDPNVNTISDPSGTDIESRGGFRVRLWGSRVQVYFLLQKVDVGGGGSFTIAPDETAISETTVNIPALTSVAQDPDTAFVEADLLLPLREDGVGIRSGDLVMIMGYFRSGDPYVPSAGPFDPEVWEDPAGRPYYLSGCQLMEYPAATWKVDVERPNGGT